MCESTAYILKDGKEEPIIEGVNILENKDGQIRIVNLFGEKRTIGARVKAISLIDHKIILEPL